MAIDKVNNGHKLWEKPLNIGNGEIYTDRQIITTTRIGISKAVDLPLRFYVKGSKFISKK